MLNKSNQNIIVESEEKNINLPIVIEDKIFQSWTLTKVRYDFTLIEKNIFVKIVELCQKYIDKKFLGQGLWYWSRVHDIRTDTYHSVSDKGHCCQE